MFRAVHPRSCASGHSIGLNRPLFHRLLHISEQRLSIEVELSLCLRWKDIWRFFIVLRRKAPTSTVHLHEIDPLENPEDPSCSRE